MAKAIRDIYGEALVEYGKENPKVVVLDADVSSSSKSGIFQAACPQRHLNVGIAEANMVGMTAGLAAVGMVPFANTFAVFMTTIGLTAARAFGSYSQLPIRLVGAYGGMSDAFDGPSHHSLEDIATMRALPNFQVYVPCDGTQTRWLVKHAIESPEPMYIRLSRDVFPDVYPAEQSFQPGKGNIVRQGTDVTIVACGLMVSEALKCADALAKQNVSARVVDMFSVKPIDRELIVACAKATGAIVSAEEHSVIGGLGGAVAEVLAQENCRVPMGFAGVPDCHGECGPYEQLKHKYGFDAEAIARKALETIAKK